MKGQTQAARSITRVYVEGVETTSEFIETENTLHICFNLETGQTIRVWFDLQSKGIGVSSNHGDLVVSPRAANLIIVKAERQ